LKAFYSVTANGKHCGKAEVKQNGLYYSISCRCRPETDGIWRLIVSGEQNEVNLGILVPADGSFVLRTNIPVKRLGKGTMQFRLAEKKSSTSGSFVPISPEEPFAYLTRLKDSFLVNKEGQLGIEMENMHT